MANVFTAYDQHSRHRTSGRHSGRPALCLHCSTGSSRQWNSLAATVDATHHLVAPDLLGYGENPPWPHGRGLGLDDEIERLLPLIESVGDPVDVVGHSFGAAVAVKLTLDRPELVRSLSVYEPVLLGLLKEDSRSRAALSEILEVSVLIGDALDLGDYDSAAARFVDFWSGRGTWSCMSKSRRMSVGNRICKVRADFDALFSEELKLAELAQLEVPVLCLSGKRSPAATRRIADLLGATLPDVQIRQFENAGHMGPLTDASAVNETIEEFFKFLFRREMHTPRTARAA